MKIGLRYHYDIAKIGKDLSAQSKPFNERQCVLGTSKIHHHHPIPSLKISYLSNPKIYAPTEAVLT